jgi:hypothetical protein
MVIEAIMDELVTMEPNFERDDSAHWPTIRASIPNDLSVYLRFYLRGATLVVHSFFLACLRFDLNDPNFCVERVQEAVQAVLDEYLEWREHHPEAPLCSYGLVPA